MKKNIVTLIVFCTSVLTAQEQTQEALPWYKRWFSGLKSEKATLSTMSYEQLCEAKERSLSNNDTFAAIRYLERMAKECPDLEALAAVLMELADLLFKDGKFTKATLLYDQYIKSFPGRTTEFATAYYKKILCSFYQTLEVYRDQTMTEETLELCNSFFEMCKSSDYESDVLSIQKECKRKLAHHELHIADNYIKQNKITSASRRLARIRDVHITVPDFEVELMLCEIRLAEKVGNTRFAQACRDEIAQRFPDQQSVVVAQSKKQKKMAHRF